MSDKNLAAVVLCAGKGTRMKSEKAKVLHSLLGRPLCTYPIARALELSASPVVPVVGHQGAEVQRVLESAFAGAPLRFAQQPDQRGTADAVTRARAALEGHVGPVLILYGDVPLLTGATLRSLLEAHGRSSAPLSLVSTHPDDPRGYGRVVRDGGRVVGVIEERDAPEDVRRIRECNAGIYVVDATFLWGALEKLTPHNAQGELYLTDLVAMAAAIGAVGHVSAPFEEVAGVNDRAELAQRAAVLRMRINTEHMRGGVTLHHPETTFIDEGVEIGPNTVIGPMVSIHAGCVIGAGVRIGQGSVLMKSTVGDGAELRPYSLLEETVVGQRCSIGPFARLRPGTVLDEEVHLGNFVETKKARIRRGSKANHLSYLGDVEIGAEVNVGAGTITCNYDGVDKHTTVLEDGVFIGSDTQLVAPVRVGAGAYVGAGSTITRDVPPGSLALSRAPQTEKLEWGARRRELTRKRGKS